MSDDRLKELSGYAWMQSRVPAQDGLVAFVPDGPRDPVVDALATSRPSRWYPVEGGTRVVMLLEGIKEYDPSRFKVEKGAWDHEHCDLCGENIQPMTLCWVTVSGRYITLCVACHAKLKP